jgi:hypothetical protein
MLLLLGWSRAQPALQAAIRNGCTGFYRYARRLGRELKPVTSGARWSQTTPDADQNNTARVMCVQRGRARHGVHLRDAQRHSNRRTWRPLARAVITAARANRQLRESNPNLGCVNPRLARVTRNFSTVTWPDVGYRNNAGERRT